jgi:SdrD B-like domain
MTFFPIARHDCLRPTRSNRKLRLVVEHCESRQLMSGSTITGTTVQDLSGAGTFTDDARLPAVTIDLYRAGSSTVLEHTSTDSNGNFSFTNLTPGNYSVQQVVPSSFLPTGALYGYPVTLSSGQVAPGKDFEDFKLSSPPTLSNLSYTVTTPGGKSTTVPTLLGNVQEGDIVKAKFNQETAGKITLVAYSAPNGDFDTSNLQQQVVFSEASTGGGTGSESLTVTVPDGYFQIDFVAGSAIDHLATNPNVTYHAQDRFIDGEHGGTHVVPKSVAVTNDVATPPAIVSMSNMAAPAVAVLSADTDVADLGNSLGRKH